LYVFPGPIITKLGVIDYVGDPTHTPILVEFGLVGAEIETTTILIFQTEISASNVNFMHVKI